MIVSQSIWFSISGSFDESIKTCWLSPTLSDCLKFVHCVSRVQIWFSILVVYPDQYLWQWNHIQNERIASLRFVTWGFRFYRKSAKANPFVSVPSSNLELDFPSPETNLCYLLCKVNSLEYSQLWCLGFFPHNK